VQRLLRDPGLSNKGQNAFTGEHAINKSLPKSSRILTRHNDPLSVQPAFPNMRNGRIQGVRSAGSTNKGQATTPNGLIKTIRRVAYPRWVAVAIADEIALDDAECLLKGSKAIDWRVP